MNKDKLELIAHALDDGGEGQADRFIAALERNTAALAEANERALKAVMEANRNALLSVERMAAHQASRYLALIDRQALESHARFGPAPGVAPRAPSTEGGADSARADEELPGAFPYPEEDVVPVEEAELLSGDAFPRLGR